MRRASQRIAIIRPVVIIFFSISSMGTAIGQDELEGYRLFFTEEERSDKGPSNTALSDPDVVAGTLPEPQPRLSAASAASAFSYCRRCSAAVVCFYGCCACFYELPPLLLLLLLSIVMEF